MRILLVFCIILLCALPSSARVLLKVDNSPSSGKSLLSDSGFEEPKSPWSTYSKGFVADTSVFHSGKASIRCENSLPTDKSGAYQSIILDQKTPRAIRATAWSKAEGVAPAPGGDYTLYLDIEYADGSWLWVQIFNFETGTHNWQMGEVLIQPEKPIKTVFVNCLLRNHTGKVWFDDCYLEEISASEGSTLFDGVSVRKSEAVHPTDGSFYLRDVAAGSDFVSFDSGTALGISLDVHEKAGKDYIRFDCTAKDISGRDRAVTIGFALPVESKNPVWWHSIRSSEKALPGRDYCDTVPIEASATGGMSKYPFSCLSGTSLAIPMDEPCVYRIGYNSDLRWHYIAFDLGFCPEQGVIEQKFSFIVYKSEDGMRGAVDKYYRLFPEYFKKRVDHEGNWMAFRQVGSVEGWEDFGFAFHEGDNDITWDAANGIYSFRYTEPMSHWMAMDKSLPRTNEQAFKMIDDNLKQTADPALREWASAVKTCLAEDDYGKPRVFFFDAPWCDGAMFLMNCNPAIPKGDTPATRASISWSKEIVERLYGDKTKPQLAGEYLDSAEMGSSYVNTRREHFRYAVCPLTFSRRTKKPAILQILSTYEFARAMADDVHGRGKLMMANGIPTGYGFMAHLLDVMGIETNWLADGKYNPLPDEILDFRRTLCYQKPYCFLMNTDYETFDHSMVEKYFQRCMFWGMFPGFFSPDAATRLYFEQPKYYNRDRDLFKKYMPVIKKIAAAGWEPLALAKLSNPQVEIERFGPGKDGALFYTARNNSQETAKTALKLDRKLGKPKGALKLPGDQELAVGSDGIGLSLAPGEVAVVEVQL